MSKETTSEFRYEQRLAEDHWLAVREGSAHFGGEGSVFNALRRITAKLEELGISYSVVGGLALNFHGFVRFTDDVDILVTKDGLAELQSKLTGRGYRPLFAGSKHLRDTEFGVRIEFLVTGDFPGDGKPKPIEFPDPAESSVEIDGIRILKLAKLIELKLASGMSAVHRMRDLSDVIDLIKSLTLPHNLALQLDSSVQDKYIELWTAAQTAREP